MEMIRQTATRLAIEDMSHVAESRRLVADVAAAMKFDETTAGRAALVVTELATNLVKHAAGGELLVQPVFNEARALQVLALDRGRGMANVAACLRDGYSTAGSSGTGLGASARLANHFEIYSRPGHGTAVLAVVGEKSEPTSKPGLLECAAVQVPKPGQDACGDGWLSRQQAGRALLFVVDGLGHGEGAADAADIALGLVRREPTSAPADLVKAVHRGLYGTRGAAVGLAQIEIGPRHLTYCGIGNIAGCVLLDGVAKSFVSTPGIAGHEARRFLEFTYAWPVGALVILHSDGLSTRWSLEAYPGLTQRHPALIAGVLYRDFRRGSDDATIVVARERMA